MNDNNLENLLSEAKPKSEVDPRFKGALYQRLMQEQKPVIKNYNFMNRFRFVLPVAALAIIAVVISVAKPQTNSKVSLGTKQEVTRLSANAFGQLNALNTNGGRGQGGGGNAQTADSKIAAPETAIGMGGGGSSAMPAELYVPTYYNYVYKGDKFEVEQDQMDVYEREKGFGSNTDLASFLDRFNIGLFDINKFQNATVDYVRASENRNNGYSVDMDLKLGTIYIGQNWEKWAMMDYSSPVTINQIPSDEESIALANQFLADYGISTENYGAPEVQNSWRILYDRAPNKSSIYVPDTVSVVYPAKISGNEVYDESGNKTGMYVSINVRNKAVSSVGEITGQHYQASAYPTEKNADRLVKIAEQGGFRNYMPFAAEGSTEPNAKKITVELGSPKIVYVRLWQTVGNESKTIYVPSLVFPITNQPADYYSQNVIVPLIKEVLDTQDQIPKGITPMMDAVR